MTLPSAANRFESTDCPLISGETDVHLSVNGPTVFESRTPLRTRSVSPPRRSTRSTDRGTDRRPPRTLRAVFPSATCVCPRTPLGDLLVVAAVVRKLLVELGLMLVDHLDFLFDPHVDRDRDVCIERLRVFELVREVDDDRGSLECGGRGHIFRTLTRYAASPTSVPAYRWSGW